MSESKFFLHTLPLPAVRDNAGTIYAEVPIALVHGLDTTLVTLPLVPVQAGTNDVGAPLLGGVGYVSGGLPGMRYVHDLAPASQRLSYAATAPLLALVVASYSETAPNFRFRLWSDPLTTDVQSSGPSPQQEDGSYLQIWRVTYSNGMQRKYSTPSQRPPLGATEDELFSIYGCRPYAGASIPN